MSFWKSLFGGKDDTKTSEAAPPPPPDINVFDAGEFYRLERAGSESFYDRGCRYFKHDGKRIFVPAARESIEPKHAAAPQPVQRRPVNVEPGAVVPISGTYVCEECQSGFRFISLDSPDPHGQVRASQRQRAEPTRRTFRAGQKFDKCPRCGDCTGWTLL